MTAFILFLGSLVVVTWLGGILQTLYPENL